MTRGFSPNWEKVLLVDLFQKSLKFRLYNFRISLVRKMKKMGWQFPTFLASLKITSKRRQAKVPLRDSDLTFLPVFLSSAVLMPVWVSEWMSACMVLHLLGHQCPRLCQHHRAGDGSCFWTSCRHGLIPSAGLTPPHPEQSWTVNGVHGASGQFVKQRRFHSLSQIC